MGASIIITNNKKTTLCFLNLKNIIKYKKLNILNSIKKINNSSSPIFIKFKYLSNAFLKKACFDNAK